MKFKEIQLGNLFEAKYGKSLPKNQRRDGSIKVYGSGGISGYHDTALVKGPGIVIGRKGTVGSLYYEKQDYFPIDTTYYIEKSDKYDLKYIFYLLNTLNLNKMNTHSAVPGLNRENLYSLIAKVPEKKYQIKISEFLQQLDSKIEINNQIIFNLEELASTLFKRWFVDFDFPDENGNPYKSNNGKMSDSELGEIPEGWKIIKLSDLVVQIKETFNPNKTEVEKVNHFSIPNFDSKKFPVIEDVNTIKSNKTKITDFTVLFSKMNPNFERVWLTELNKSYLNVCSPEFIALDCKNINLQTYTYFLCKSTAFNRFLVNNATGSTGSRQRIKPSIAMGFKFVGAVDLINKYGEICSGISEQIMNLRNQNENLKEMRDALLPKLLSGEIELPEDEEV
ncbi:type I restriction enzyme, S subunit [Enterococcus sp. DIV2379]|uniref:restriction endonuclease subunit S n=1 Tax=Enterococcus sp. DIV2379 TaxID=2774684 RepID=UPI003D30050B